MWYTILACVAVVALLVVGVAMVLLRRTSRLSSDAPIVQAAQASNKAICRNRVNVDGVTTANCDDWAAKGNCTSADHAAYMRRYCELSCANAGHPVPCTIANKSEVAPEVYYPATSKPSSDADLGETSRTLHIHSLLDELTAIADAEESEARQSLKMCTEYFAEQGRISRATAQLNQLEVLQTLHKQLEAAEVKHEHNLELECQGLARAWVTTLTDGEGGVSNADVKVRTKLCPEQPWDSPTCPGNDTANCIELATLALPHMPCTTDLPSNEVLVECMVPTCTYLTLNGVDVEYARSAGFEPDIGATRSDTSSSELTVTSEPRPPPTLTCTIDPNWGTGCSAPRFDKADANKGNHYNDLNPKTKATVFRSFAELNAETPFKYIKGTGGNGKEGVGYMLRKDASHVLCTANDAPVAGALSFLEVTNTVQGIFDNSTSSVKREYSQVLGPYELAPVLCRDVCEEKFFGSVSQSKATIQHGDQSNAAETYVPHYKKFFKDANASVQIPVTQIGMLSSKYETSNDNVDWSFLPASGYFATPDGKTFIGYFYENDTITLSGVEDSDPQITNLMQYVGAFAPENIKCTQVGVSISEDEARFQCLTNPYKYVGYTYNSTDGYILYTHGGPSTTQIMVQHNISVVHACVSTCMNKAGDSTDENAVSLFNKTAAALDVDGGLLIEGVLFNDPSWITAPPQDVFLPKILPNHLMTVTKRSSAAVCTDMTLPNWDADAGRINKDQTQTRSYAALEDRRGCNVVKDTTTPYTCSAYAPLALALTPQSDPCLRNIDEPTCATTVACAWHDQTKLCNSVVCSRQNSEEECNKVGDVVTGHYRTWGVEDDLSSIGRTPVLMPNLGISFNFELFFSMKKLMPGLGISFNRFSALNLVYLTPQGGFRFRQVYDPRYQAGAGATREHTRSGHQVCPCQTRVTPVGIVAIFGHSGKHSRGPTFKNQLRAKRPAPRLATVARRGHIFSLILRLRPQTPPNIVGRWLAPRISCHV